MSYNSWANIPEEKRLELLDRRNIDNIYALAKEVNMKPQTLGRRLREVARQRTYESGGVVSEAPKSPSEGKLTFNEQENILEITSTLDRVKSLEDLLREAHVDLDIWEVERHIVNTWEVGAKTSKKSLQWTEGIMDGYVEADGELTIETLFQVKAWLIRKTPIEVAPVIHPVRFNLTPVTPPDRTFFDPGLRAALIVPDAQIGFKRDLRTGKLDPFHDRRALDIVLQVAAGFEFDQIVFLGDWLDLPEWTDKFVRSPEFVTTTQPAVDEGTWWLSQFRSVSLLGTQMDLIEGNHEVRMPTTLMTHLAEAYRLKPTNLDADTVVSVPYLLGLDDLEINWIGDYPNGKLWLNDALTVEHGSVAKANPGDTAKDIALKSPVSVIFGHIHRIERATRNADGRNGQRKIRAVSPGCVCRVDGVVPGHRLKQHWQQGFAIAHYDDHNYHAIETIEIEDGRAIYGGEVFLGEDPLEQIIEDTGWKNFL